MALRKKAKNEETREYLKAFPQLEGKFSIHYCHSADGVHLD